MSLGIVDLIVYTITRVHVFVTCFRMNGYGHFLRPGEGARGGLFFVHVKKWLTTPPTPGKWKSGWPPFQLSKTEWPPLKLTITYVSRTPTTWLVSVHLSVRLAVETQLYMAVSATFIWGHWQRSHCISSVSHCLRGHTESLVCNDFSGDIASVVCHNIGFRGHTTSKSVNLSKN